MRRAFEVTPPDLRKVWLLPATGLCAAVVGVAFAARTDARAWMLLAVLAPIFAFIAWFLRRRDVLIDDNRLQIRAGINSISIPLDALDIASARVIDMDREPGLRPMWKTFGTSLPGFHAGHFRLRDRSRAFLLLTDRRKVIALRERDGRNLLLSLSRPQALIDALGHDSEHHSR